MPNFANSPVGQTISAANRAIRAWSRIQRNSVEVSMLRDKVAQTAQTVRIEVSSGGSSASLPTGTIGLQSIVIYGVKDHPSAEVPDTDIKRMDRIVWGGKEYTVETVVTPPGELQAFGVVRG